MKSEARKSEAWKSEARKSEAWKLEAKKTAASSDTSELEKWEREYNTNV